MSRNCAEDLTSVDLDHVNAAELSISSTLSSTSVSLYPFIRLDQSTALNVTNPTHLARIVRPYDSRDVVKTNDELVGTANDGENGGPPFSGGCLESQEDDNDILIHIRFSELVKVKSVLVGTGGGRTETAPKRVKVFVNRPAAIGFDEASNEKPEQDFELLENVNGEAGATEYPVRLSKFSNVSSLDLFFNGARADQAILYYLGFMGESRVLKKEPGEPMTIGAENAVHKMVDGARDEKRLPDTVR